MDILDRRSVERRTQLATVATVIATRWHQERFGRVAPRRQWPVFAVIGVFVVAMLVVRGVDLTGFDSPVFGSGVLLGLVIAALAWQAPWAYAQHLVIGLGLAGLSAVPLGAWVDIALPPAAAGLVEPVHPLAAYDLLLAPAWLLAAGVVEHVRLLRAEGSQVGTRS